MDTSAFKAALDAELEKTRASIAALRDLTAPVAPDEAIGRISRMDAINNKAINDAALRKAEEKLQQLDRMTVLVDEPGFGLCKKCGAAIPMQRLILMPQSMFCVRCAN
ncbi:MAG: TraR/DksA C4-type zinc finger protein [Flavobacteriales bacterium]|nr:TraR/DksA C4-type zinc finger protein [Flavobacteriales bacterium]